MKRHDNLYVYHMQECLTHILFPTQTRFVNLALQQISYGTRALFTYLSDLMPIYTVSSTFVTFFIQIIQI